MTARAEVGEVAGLGGSTLRRQRQEAGGGGVQIGWGQEGKYSYTVEMIYEGFPLAGELLWSGRHLRTTVRASEEHASKAAFAASLATTQNLQLRSDEENGRWH